MKLHIGGKQAKEGWKILNIVVGKGVDYVGDFSDLSQFDDESIEIVYASHVLEHVGQAKVMETLKGVRRILRPNGQFLVSVPDLDVLCHAFVAPYLSNENKFHIMRMIFGGQSDEFDFHYFGWNFRFLRNFTTQAGFSKITRVISHGLFDDASDYAPFGFRISLNAVIVK